MPVELNADPPATGDRPSSRGGRSWRAVRDVVVVLVAFAVAGAVCGLLWESLWDAPPGVAYKHEWYLKPEGLPDDFSGTGLYVLVALVGGLVVAAVVALALGRNELITMVAVLVGAALAAWVMYVVGHRLGPPDPRKLAETADDLAPLPSDLRVHGKAAFLAFPVGAVAGLALVYFLFTRRSAPSPDHPLPEMSATGR
jgi:hypothetical protein